MSEKHDEVVVAKMNEKVEAKEVKQSKPGCTLRLGAYWSVVGALVITVIVLAVTLLNTEQQKERETEQETEGCPERSDHGYIILAFGDCPSNNQVKAFKSAADRLSSVVDGTTNVFVRETDVELRFSDVCGSGFINSNPVVHLPGPNEGLVITLAVEDIDGVDGFLVQAGPCGLNFDTNLPYAGLMLFDVADLKQMELEGILEDVILHEMLHVLGFGSLWDKAPFDFITEEFERGILEDEVFSYVPRKVFPENEPKFVAASATLEYSSLTGVEEEFVPVQGADRGDGRVFDVANGEGRGSVDMHWNKADFGTELMTIAISGEDLAHPLSAVTLASLNDIGYNVSLGEADAFNLPGSNESLQSLRGSKTVFDLSGDVFRMSPKPFY